ncbi:Inositol phoshorylceramide synthase regulatory subunit kei1 [Elsinoe australis]|uniref:Inositol phoshorylceramide synthase regulatory subunit kei1 n=1 Tax=Elsinoe australis TaxID=40998 RepID=A0A2P8AFI4_9PEZI|nr:Inositol phoshorylceramide synthase regulatory subunit kei1 [Elsinoe australis]
MALPALVRLFRPRTFFHFISLLTATEFITVSLLINKVEGVYGILALFTGYPLSAFQLSMYIYSIVVLVLVCYLGPHIRKQSPLQNLVLAWVYILDSLINAMYTALFGIGWFIVLAQTLSPSPTEGDAPKATTPGGKTINDTAGFTNPESGGVDKVEIIAEPRPDKIPPGQDAKVITHGDGSGLGNAVFQSGSIMSITVISFLWFVRLYSILVVMAYARQVLRGYSQSASAAANRKPASADDADSTTDHLMADSKTLANPFHYASPLGQGWQGKLGRFLTKFPETYWLGRDQADEEWVRGADERFRHRMANRTPLVRNPPPRSKGTGERERRARSGTGPPPPGMDVGRRSGESGADSRPSGEL